MEIVCKWVICFVIAKGAQQCGRVSTGSRQELSQVVLKLDGTPGDLLTSECIKEGDRYQIDWSKK